MNNFNYKQPFVAVGAVIEKDGKFILVKEADGPDRGQWNLPAGKWEDCKNLVDEIKKEVLEETGFNFIPKKIVGFYIISKKRPNYTVNVLRIVSTGELTGDQCEVCEEIEEVKWFTKEEILKMDKNSLRSGDIKNMIKDYESGQRYPLEILKHFEE